MKTLSPQSTEKPIYGKAEALEYLEEKRRELDAFRQSVLTPKGKLEFAELEASLNDLERRVRLDIPMDASSLDILN